MSELLKFITHRKINISWFDVFEFVIDLFSSWFFSRTDNPEEKSRPGKVIKWLLIGLIAFGIIYLIYNFFFAIEG